VRNAWTLLSGILETAVEYGYLTMNPARGVKFPPQEARQAPAIIAGDDFARLLNELAEPYRTMVELIAATGLRGWRAAGRQMAGARSGGWNADGSRVGVRGQGSATEDAEVQADDSAGTARGDVVEGTSRSIDA